MQKHLLKRISIIGASAVMALGLAACGSNSSKKKCSSSSKPKATKVAKSNAYQSALKSTQKKDAKFANVKYNKAKKTLVFTPKNNNDVKNTKNVAAKQTKSFAKCAKQKNVKCQVSAPNKKMNHKANKMNNNQKANNNHKKMNQKKNK